MTKKKYNLYLSISCNLGDRKKNISEALHLVSEAFSNVTISSVYDVEPIGFKQQDNFLLCVVSCFTEKRLEENWEMCLDIQKVFEKSLTNVKNGPRNMDVDLLFYDSITIKEPIVVPHPEIQNRKCVLSALKELDPTIIHPLLSKTVADLLEECNDDRNVESLGKIFK